MWVKEDLLEQGGDSRGVPNSSMLKKVPSFWPADQVNEYIFIKELIISENSSLLILLNNNRVLRDILPSAINDYEPLGTLSFLLFDL